MARLWNWLPAFRAVAEYESLQRAGLALAQSASALSRTIKLLEDAWGGALFLRSPAGLTLTDDGRALLAATREAMRRVHDVLPAERQVGLIAAGSDAIATRLLFDAALESLPHFTLQLRTVPRDELPAQLRTGGLDVALIAGSTARTTGLTALVLGALEHVVASPCAIRPERAAVLSDDERADAAVRCDTFEQLIEAARRLNLRITVPSALLPPGWTVHERAHEEVFSLCHRDNLDGPPPWLPALEAALAQRGLQLSR